MPGIYFKYSGEMLPKISNLEKARQKQPKQKTKKAIKIQYARLDFLEKFINAREKRREILGISRRKEDTSPFEKRNILVRIIITEEQRKRRPQARTYSAYFTLSILADVSPFSCLHRRSNSSDLRVEGRHSFNFPFPDTIAFFQLTKKGIKIKGKRKIGVRKRRARFSSKNWANCVYLRQSRLIRLTI